MASIDQQEQIHQKRERSPSFPYLDLGIAMEHTRKLYRVAKMNEVRISDVASAWGMAVNSGSFLRYVAATGQFGLIETNGSSAQKKLRVSSTARRIIEDDRPGVREQLLSEAALMPKLIRGLFFGEDGMPHWGRDRPIDAIAESSLKFDLEFSSEAARRFLVVYDQTIKHVLDGNNAEGEGDSSGAEALEFGENEVVEPVMRNEKAYAAPPTALHLSELNRIDFRSEGAGVISISATLDAEGLDLLAKKIEAFKMLIG